MKKCVVVKGVCGLGNRLLALSGISDLVDKRGIKCVVDWRDEYYSDDGDDAFRRFFEIKTKYRMEEKLSGSVHPEGWEGNLNTPFDRLARFNGVWLKDRKKAVGLSGDHDISVVAPHVPPYSTTEGIMKLRKNIHRLLAVKPSAMEMAEEFRDDNFKEYTIGVHIRMACPLKRKVALTILFDKLNEIITSHSDARILVASDSTMGRDEVVQQYGKRVFFIPKWFPPPTTLSSGLEKEALHMPRSRSEQMAQSRIYREAVKEMLVLSLCDHLIYQHNSSFGACSAVLSNLSEEQFEPWGLNEEVVRDPSWGPKKRKI
jgi:hypothetical protein